VEACVATGGFLKAGDDTPVVLDLVDVKFSEVAFAIEMGTVMAVPVIARL
jgi:hypothetical protein